MRNQYNIEVNINKDEFKQKLGIKDGDPGKPGKDAVIDYDRLTASILPKLSFPSPEVDYELLTQMVLPALTIPEPIPGSPDTGSDIISKINAAPNESLIHASKITGLSTLVLGMAGGVGTSSASSGFGLVTVVHKDGTTINYPSTSNSDTARGSVLLSAIAKAVTGDTFYLSANTFDVQAHGIDLTLNNTGSINLIGAGKYSTIIKSSVNQMMINAASNSYTGNLSLIVTSTGATFTLPWGNETAVVTNAVLDMVYISGRTDGIYFQNFDNSGKIIANIYDCDIDTKWDGIFYTELGTINVYNTRITAIADATVNSGLVAEPVLNSNGGILNLFNCQMSASGGTTHNYAVNDSGGFINIYGGKYSSSGTGSFDLIWFGGGALSIASDVVFDDTKTSGTITQLMPQSWVNSGNNIYARHALTGGFVGIGTNNPLFMLDILDANGSGQGIRYADAATANPSFQVTGDLDVPTFLFQFGDVNNLNGHVLATLDTSAEEFRVDRGRVNADHGIFGTNRSATSIDGNWAALFNGELVIAPGGNSSLADITIISDSSYTKAISMGLSVPGTTVTGDLWFSTETAASGHWSEAFHSVHDTATYFPLNVGIGLTSTTARLHLAAGATGASKAPLKFTSGPLMTSAEAGAEEFLTDLRYMTKTTGPTRAAILAAISGRLTAKTAAQATVVNFTPPADGSFMVSANVLVTASTLHNFTVTCSYTDEGNTARTVTMPFSVLAGTFVTAITNASGAVPYEGIPIHIRVKASTAITIATVGTFTTVTYNVEGAITQIS